MSSASLQALDPTLIGSVRDQLAQDFAKRIFDAVPDVSECIDFEAETCNSASGKKRFERASQLLYTGRRDLQLQTAAVVRRIFDEKLVRLIDGANRGARLSLEGITLLADERLDEEIALNNCSRRLKEQCDYELWSLTQRIVAVTGIAHPADSQNPVFPQTFAQALMEAIGVLETNAAVRLVLFKTFGPVLLEIVPAVFTAANVALSARGIDVESGNYYGRPISAPERPSISETIQQEITTRVNFELAVALRKILSNSASALPAGAVQLDYLAHNKILAANLQPPTFQTGSIATPG